jgi:hypothetical protein
MTTLSQIRGLLLEEVLLYLLEFSGYKTILTDNNDDTLHQGHSGLEVKGRGCSHQIDAIADFVVATPFSNPQRLLVEAKCYSDNYPIGIEYIRNAVGVLKDVSEYWVPNPGDNAKRYHYQYALFSASGFTTTAERYAFAQDIYLFPLQESSFIKPIVENIRSINHIAFQAENDKSINISLTSFRQSFRILLHENSAIFENEITKELLLPLTDTCRRLKGVMLGMVSRQFPIILTPSPEFNINEMVDSYEVEMHGFYNDQRGWTLSHHGIDILSFDIPINIFQMYAERGALKPTSALNMKSAYFTEIQAIVIQHSVPKVVTFRLDHDWLERLISQVNQTNQRHGFDQIDNE